MNNNSTNNNGNGNNDDKNNNNNIINSKKNIPTSIPTSTLEKCSICKGLWYYDTNRMKAGLPPLCIGEYSEIAVKPDLKAKIESYEDYIKDKAVDSNLVFSIGLNIYNKQRMIAEKFLFPYKPVYENHKRNSIKPEDEMNKNNSFWVDIHENIGIVIAKVPDVSLKAIEKYMYFIQRMKNSKLNNNNSVQKTDAEEDRNGRNIKTSATPGNEINIAIKHKVTSRESINDRNKERFKSITDKTVEYFLRPDELLKRIGLSAGIELPQISKTLVVDLIYKSKEKVKDIILPSIKLCGNTLLYSVIPNIHRNLVNFYNYYSRK